MCARISGTTQGRQIKIKSLMGETITVEVMKSSDDGEMSTRSWRYEVTGVLKEGGESDYQVFIPVRDVQAINQWVTGKRINRSKDGYDRVIVQAADSKQVQEIQKAIQDMGFTAFFALDTVREINSFFRRSAGDPGRYRRHCAPRRGVGHRQHLEHGDPGADA